MDDIYRDESGKDNALYVGDPAWHRKGKVFQIDAPPTYDEMMSEGGLDYECEVRGVEYTRYVLDDNGNPTGDTYKVPSELASIIVRTDTQQELGVASPKYPCTLNRTAMLPLKVLVEEGLANVASAAVLGKGDTAFATVRWNMDKFTEATREAMAAENILPFGMIINYHTGKNGTTLQNAQMRVDCRNMLNMSLRAAVERITIRHSALAPARIIEAAEDLWGSVINRFDGAALGMIALRQRVLTEAEFSAAVLDVIAPIPAEKTARGELVMRRVEEKREAVKMLWTKGAGHVGDGSAWEAYNGAVQAIDHGTNLWKTRTDDARLESIIGGELFKLKQGVYSNVLALAGIE